MKLVKGSGHEEAGACWMSALHWYTRPEEVNSWTDKAPFACIGPSIRSACIHLNDWCESDEERAELIGPHLFTPLGTMSTRHVEQKRIDLFVRFARKCAAASASASAAYAADAAAYAAAYAANAAYAAYAAAYAADADADADADAAAAAADAAAAAADADAAADAAARADAQKRYRKLYLEVILKCCEIGAREEVVPAKSKDQVLEMLSR